MILHTKLENRKDSIKITFIKRDINKGKIIKLKDVELNLLRELNEARNCQHNLLK